MMRIYILAVQRDGKRDLFRNDMKHHILKISANVKLNKNARSFNGFAKLDITET